MESIIVVSKIYSKRCENQGCALVCYHCGGVFGMGDKVVRRVSRYRCRKFYHVSCWKSLFI
jgi:hypothetical protein